MGSRGGTGCSTKVSVFTSRQPLQAAEPWAITDEDFGSLVKHFGPERALDVVWWACRCHYMTCVADAFQLPLERENVFARRKPPAGKSKKP